MHNSAFEMPEGTHSSGAHIRSTTTSSSDQPIGRIHAYVDLPPLEPLGSGPVEPRIDDLLMKVAETQDLQTLETVHLRIASTMICIQHLEVFLPNLVVLDLNGSDLSSLRDLGTQLKIKSLNVSRCGLNSLDGTTGLTTLVELVADENAIRGVEQLCNLSDLKKLSLKGNKITTYDAVSFMCLCPNILDLDLRDNPVAALDEYRDYMSDIMPTLKLLDAQAFYDVNGAGADESLSSSEYSSSTSEQRSASRGSSVVSFVDLAHDTAPLSGSIVSAVRRRKTAWTSRSHSASSLSSRSSSSLSGGPPASSDPPPPPATTALASVSHNH